MVQGGEAALAREREVWHWRVASGGSFEYNRRKGVRFIIARDLSSVHNSRWMSNASVGRWRSRVNHNVKHPFFRNGFRQVFPAAGRTPPEYHLQAGDVGTVTLVHRHGGYEVKFATLDGETVAEVTLSLDHVRPVGHREIAHVRVVPTA